MPDLNPDGTVYVPPVDLDQARSIAECQICDGDGYTGSRRVCDHRDRAQTAARGHELVQAELAKIRQRKADRARGARA